jgi:ABC-type transport system involved in cytochrome bd biosynthesis fused ATPase/permease subunit
VKIDFRLLLKGSSRYLFLASILSGFVWSLFLLVNAWLISTLIIAIINEEAINPYFIYLILLWIFRAAFLSIFENWTLKKALEAKFEFRTSATRNSYGMRQFSPAVMSNLLTKALNSIDTYYGRFIPQLLFSFITPITIIIFIATKDLLSAGVAIFTLPLIPFFGALIGRYTSDAVGKKWRTLGALSSYFEDSLNGYATLKLFGRTKGQSARIEEMGARYSEETMKVLRVSFLSSLALELAATISVAVIAVEVGLRLVAGEIEFSNALMILILAPEIYFPLRNAAALFHASTDGTEALDKLQALPTSGESNSKRTDYPKGIKVWIGASGSGKTTAAMKLINNFESSGIGWVPQNPKLAEGAIRKQFQLVRPGITDSEIEQLLKEVNLNMNELPNGLDSKLESGSELLSAASGGQIRKIAIARALASKPTLLITDEPTADLDEISAKVIIQLIRRFATDPDRGVIIITHDESLIIVSDEIVRYDR